MAFCIQTFDFVRFCPILLCYTNSKSQLVLIKDPPNPSSFSGPYSFHPNSSPVFLVHTNLFRASHIARLCKADICAIFIQDFQGAQELVLCSGQLKSALWLWLSQQRWAEFWIPLKEEEGKASNYLSMGIM